VHHESALLLSTYLVNMHLTLLHMSCLQATRWKQLWRPHLTPCILQPDQLSFLLKTRTREAMRWTTMSEDPDHIITQQVGCDLCWGDT
jgi:hypothetical protein